MRPMRGVFIYHMLEADASSTAAADASSTTAGHCPAACTFP